MRKLVILVGLALLLPATARAQAPEARTGPWLAVGAGGGWIRFSCSICSTDRNIGVAGTVRVGTEVRPGLLLGAEIDVWTREDEGASRHFVGTFMGAAYLYPNPAGGLYVRGAAGAVAYRAAGDLASNLLGVAVGAGYELPVGEGLVLANELSLLGSSFGALRTGDGTVADDVSLSLLQLRFVIRRR